MTFAWYGHLRNFNDRKWYIAALLSWGIALFEYLFQVPANRIGYSQYSLGQLKILQEVITLSVFAPFALFLHAAAAEAQFFVGGPLHAWGRVFHVSAMIALIRSHQAIGPTASRHIIQLYISSIRQSKATRALIRSRTP